MEIEFSSVSQFKDILSMCSALHSDISISFLPEEMNIKIMSDDSIAFINFSAFKSFFNKYEIEKPVKISVFLDDLLKILKYAKSADRIQMKYEGERLEITILDKYKSVFKVPLVNGDFSPSAEPNLKFDSYIELNAGLLKELIEKGLSLDDTVGFILDKNKFIVYSKGDEKEYNVELSLGETPEISAIKADKRIESKYQGEILYKIVSYLDDDKNVKLYFSSDYPLKIEYSLENANLIYLQAQRIS
ncbi:MAG: hypothetical protein QXX36_02425 [Candidatus Rehaiarchaeum fermentans]|nr:hypothetical protein [Candidatus Rehaiarchaeum fermentans]MCW1302455.1 hypothetical protein [Candidatus Rehaiarchaeum fermentans]